MDAAITLSVLKRESLLNAPLTLKEPVFWRFSALRCTSHPVMALRERE
jgi:hypothetical protein